MRLIDEKDVEKINAKITPETLGDFSKKLSKESYYKVVTGSEDYLTEINYNSLAEVEAEVVKINANIDKKLLRIILITSVKARAKYDRELDEKLYEYAEEHKNDIPEFVYAL